MFKDKQLTKGAKGILKLTGQETDKPAFPKMGFSQGDLNAPVTFWYKPNSPDMKAK